MALTSGTRFGPYEVVEQIGAGGMGEVWRATDTNLGRDVAVKVLPRAFVDDADRLARFRREAEVLASLNHANIATIHGLEQADDQTVIVMELVEGPTLADRIKDGPIPPDEALAIALQVVAALEAAHARQIVHRDLKPANVKVRDDGTVKVLDFGISKPIDPQAISGSAVMTTPAMTQTGVILGTAAYMSPEQARGRFVDERTDIWAFGCLLFEMLTGQAVFGGDDVMLTLARVLDRDADLRSIPKTISPAVRHTIRLCLSKDPRRRIADIRDVRLALEGAFESEMPRDVERAAPVSPLRRAGVPLAALIAGAAIAGVAVLFATRPAPPVPAPVNRFDYDIPAEPGFRRAGRPVIALSRDGRQLAINTNDGIFLRRMDELAARLVPGTEEDLSSPFFSPDGQLVAYYTASGSQLKRISISGGAPVVIARDIDNPIGASWEADGTILLGQEPGIVRVSANGGTPELVIPAEPGERLHGPQLLPDGDSVLFSAARSGDWDAAEIVVASLATGERTVILPGGSDARYLPSGHLVYAYEDILFGVAFDLATLAVSGGPVPLVQGVTRAANPAVNTPAANYGIADDGTLAYLTGAPFGDAAGGSRSIIWVDRDGNATDTGMPLCGCADNGLALSPDGTRAAVTIIDSERGDSDIWIWSFAAGTLTRLTFETGDQERPVWTPDGRRIVYASAGEGIMARAADGTGTVETLLAEPAQGLDPWSLDPDGNVLFGMNADIYVLDVAGDGGSSPLLAEEFAEALPMISPDGRWIAYASAETGSAEVYVRPYPDVESGKWQVSSAGGVLPRWSADGSRLYFVDTTAAQLMETAVETEPSFSRRTPAALFSYIPYRGYDVSADGERFLEISSATATAATASPSELQAQIIIVQNWADELERLVPTR